MSTGQDWGAKRAAAYDRRVRELFPAYEELHAAALAAVTNNAPPGARVLVIGAGTGYEAAALARAGYQVTALDPSGSMLELARSRPGAESVEFVEGTMEALPSTPRYAAAMSILVMHFLPDDGAKEQYLKGAAARCVAGANLVLADLVGEPGTDAFEKAFADWGISLAEDSNPGAVERDVCKIREDVHFVPPERISALLNACGLSAEGPVWRSGWLALWNATKSRAQ